MKIVRKCPHPKEAMIHYSDESCQLVHKKCCSFVSISKNLSNNQLHYGSATIWKLGYIFGVHLGVKEWGYNTSSTPLPHVHQMNYPVWSVFFFPRCLISIERHEMKKYILFNGLFMFSP